MLRWKVEVLFNPLLEDCEHACKSSKGGIFVFLDDSEHVAGAYAQNKNTSARPCVKNVGGYVGVGDILRDSTFQDVHKHYQQCNACSYISSSCVNLPAKLPSEGGNIVILISFSTRFALN